MDQNVREIDLLALFIRIFQFCKDHFIILFFTGVIGGALGIAVCLLYPKSYRYEISGLATEIPADVITKTLNTSGRLLSGNIDSLNKQETVSKGFLSKIKSISAVEDSKNSQQVIIKLVTNQPVAKDTAEQFIASLLNNNSFIIERLDFKKKQIEKIIGFIDKQIDNYNGAAGRILEDQGIVIQGEETPTALFLKRKQYEYQLNYLMPLVINNFPLIPESTVPSIYIFIISGSIITLLLVLVYFLFNKLNCMAKNLEKQNLNVVSYNKTA